MSATLPMPPSIPERRSRAGAFAVAAYVAVLAAALASGRDWLDELAAFMLASLILWPGLRRRSGVAVLLWSGATLGIGSLAATGRGALALDFMPVMVNAALSWLFAHTLAPESEPLIARAIAVLEGAARLQRPKVAAYARALTSAWALLLGVQAALLALLIACAVPDGVLASFGLRSPIAIAGGWRWYVHLGSYATVLAFMLVEYAFRRWHLRHIPHVPLHVFLARLARRWPALARSVMEDVPARRDA